MMGLSPLFAQLRDGGWKKAKPVDVAVIRPQDECSFPDE